MVGSSGIGIDEEKYRFNAIDLYKPPLLSMTSIIAGYQELAECTDVVNRDDLHIDNVADQYIKYMRRIL